MSETCPSVKQLHTYMYYRINCSLWQKKSMLLSRPASLDRTCTILICLARCSALPSRVWLSLAGDYRPRYEQWSTIRVWNIAMPPNTRESEPESADKTCLRVVKVCAVTKIARPRIRIPSSLVLIMERRIHAIAWRNCQPDARDPSGLTNALRSDG